MEQQIIKFIAALRSLGVRVSLAESADAFSAIDKLGVQDRELFRLSLRATLIKAAQDQKTFDELFPLFFSAQGPPPMMDMTHELSEEEANQIAQALQNMNRHLQEMLQRLMQGQALSKEELERLAQRIGLQHAVDPRYQEWMARRMEQAMGFNEVREAMQELMETLQQLGMNAERREQIRQLLESNQQGMSEQIRNFVGSRIAENMSEQPNQRDSLNQLMDRHFSDLSESDMQRLRAEVHRLATILRSRVALRQKRAKSGQLDPKATIRANLKHNGVPFELKHRSRTLKPKLVVICDISTSMRYCSELMLTFLHSMQDVISKTSAFAFIDHLEFITPEFAGKASSEAVATVLNRMPPGYYSTDLGYSLHNFFSDFMDKIDSKTTLIVVGDARNNYNDPQVDIFRQMARRSYRSLWINPEPEIQWGTGDSDMWKYAPHCDDILRAGTLNELASAVDQLLS
ncbi:MAG: VWA domain-containing protein [Anaerolineales bacterium]|nr:VWA domain-containing protein [Anaerolineales bacterium]